ncbi:MAG: hypothetical protein QMD06_01635, partial [Candidatus Altarchaeum sp.]|nr:hypothetical protein [Candidatus Altarchaeum sp.]
MFGILLICSVNGVNGEIFKVQILKYDNQTYTNDTINLTYDSSNSYLDNLGSNPEIYLRVYSTEESDLNGRWVGLGYKVGDSYRIISTGETQHNNHSIDNATFLSRLGNVSNVTVNSSLLYYSNTNFQFNILSVRGQYPGIVYAVVTDDSSYINSSAIIGVENALAIGESEEMFPNGTRWIRLDPETDGWLIGHDHYNNGSQTCHLSENFTYEDLAHGSYRMKISTSPGNVNVTVRAAYYNTYYDYSGGTCEYERISVDTGFIVVGIKKVQNFLNETLLNADKDMIN